MHGYDQTADFYAPLLERWASVGYVVIGPTFPILSGIPGGASHVDYDKLFGDATFVIDQTLAAGAGTPIAGLADGTRIAAAGHSDGEMVSFTLGFGACCREPRIRSVITMAGDLSNAGDRSAARHRDADPARHGDERRVRPVPALDRLGPRQPHRAAVDAHAASTRVTCRRTRSPATRYFELVSVATVDFLDGTLKGHPERLDRLAADVAAHPDLANLER